MSPNDLARNLIRQRETRAWTRGFFNALAYHCEGSDLEEGIESSGLLTPEAAIQGGAEEQDVRRDNVQAAFRAIQARRKCR